MNNPQPAPELYDEENLPVDEDYCDSCYQPCQGNNIDNGIGCYEFWGQKGVDTCIEYVSDCCEATVMCNGVEQEFEPDFDEPDDWR